MTTPAKLQFTTPVGRYVGGSLYEPRTTDYDNKPLVVKTGPNAGQPRKEFSFGLAFPKTPGATHFAQEAWLRPLYDMAAAAFPNGETQRHDFAWKITDGDSTIPNKKGVKPASREGFPGHWVVWFSGGQAPKIYNADGTQQIVEPNAVKPGYFLQVNGNVTDNKPSASPGIYINHNLVAFSAYGPEISFGPDASQAGFGNAALPPGASATPPAGAFNPAAIALPPVPGAPVPPPVPVAAPLPVPAGLVQMPGAAYTIEACRASGWTDDQIVANNIATRPVAVPAPLPPVGSAPIVPGPAPIAVAPPPLPVVTPNPAILAVPVPPPVPAAPAAPARVMLPAAGGATYEQLIAKGWTDALLVQHSMMQA